MAAKRQSTKRVRSLADETSDLLAQSYVHLLAAKDETIAVLKLEAIAARNRETANLARVKELEDLLLSKQLKPELVRPVTPIRTEAITSSEPIFPPSSDVTVYDETEDGNRIQQERKDASEAAKLAQRIDEELDEIAAEVGVEKIQAAPTAPPEDWKREHA